MENEADYTTEREAPLVKLLRFAELPNIVAELDDNELLQIGKRVVKTANDDDASRDDWKKKSERAMELALQVVEEKTFPWDNASNVKYPLITVGALQFHARAFPAIVQGNKIVKGQVTGRDEQGQKLAQADRVAAYMNYQLMEEQAEWVDQMDRLLLALPIEGCEFKKTYFDPSLGRNVSEWVRPLDFIVHYKTKDLVTCPRQTHRLYFYPQEIIEKQRGGVWTDIELNIGATEVEDEKLQEFYEQHCLLDLDEDGYKEPYCVTVHVQSEKVVRIKAAFYQDDIEFQVNGQPTTIKKIQEQVQQERERQRGMMAQFIQQAREYAARTGIFPAVPQIQSVPDFDPSTAGKIVKIDRAQYFTKYTFIPAPDGGFYDIGFGQLIGPLSESIDTTINQMIDAGTLANTMPGFVRDGVTIGQKRGPVKFTLGELKPIKLPPGVPIRDAIYQMQVAGPSAVLFSLLGMLIQGVKDITGVQDIMTGAKEQNETATTTLARIEQGLKVFQAIHLRVYRGLKDELKKLYRLNGIYLQPETYFRVLDSQDEGVITLTDFQNDGTDVQPVSDPSVSTTMQKMAKVEVLMSLKGDPGINPDEVNRRFLEALEAPNPDALIVPKEKRQAPPDPKLMELQIKAMTAEAEAQKTKAEVVGIYAKAMEAIASAEAKEMGVQLDQYRAQLDALKVELGNDTGRAAAMEGRPGNQGDNQPPPGVPGGMQPGGPGVGGPGGSGDIGNGGSLPGELLPGQV